MIGEQNFVKNERTTGKIAFKNLSENWLKSDFMCLLKSREMRVMGAT